MGINTLISFRFLLNFPLGLAIGSIAAFSLAWAFEGSDNPEFSEWASALFIGVCTLVAAALAVQGVKAGIEHSKDQEARRRAAANEAARAILPLVLMELRRVTEAAIEYELERTGEFPTMLVTGLSNEIKSDLRMTLEVMSGDERAALAEIPAILQVLIARMQPKPNYLPKTTDKSFLDQTISEDEKSQRLESVINWTTLQTLIDSLFAYSRGIMSEYSRDITEDVLRNLDWTDTPSGFHLKNDALFRKALEIREQFGLEFGTLEWRNE